MRSGSVLAIVIVLATVVGAAFSPLVLASSGFDETGDTFYSDGSQQSSLAGVTEYQPPPPADPQQVITINVTVTGSADWTVESRFLLESEEDVEHFLAFAESVSEGESDVGYDRELFDDFLSIASEHTERDMAIIADSWDDPRVVQSDTDSDTQIGILSYSFRWTSFAESDDDQLLLGDVFLSEDGTWLEFIDAGQHLVINAPSGHGYAGSTPVPIIDGALIWEGPHEFAPGEIHATYVVGDPNDDDDPLPPPNGDDDGDDTDDVDPNDTDDTDDPPIDDDDADDATTDEPDESALPIGGFWILALALALIASGGIYVLSQGRPKWVDDAVEATVLKKSSTDSSAETDEPEPPDGEATMSSFDEREIEEVEADEAADLLSDEERITQLLKDNDGRMKQATIVKETKWSNAKVSQLLSKMDDEDEVDKLRIGRENLITLPDVDPTEVEE